MHESKLNRMIRLSLLPAVAAGFSLAAGAQTSAGHDGRDAARTHASSGSYQGQNASYRAVRASEVIGMSVRNEKGENLGQISDMVVNMDSGDVRYAILTFDPGIFSGERLFAVPIKELRMAPDRNDVVFRMSRDRLEQADIGMRDWNRNYLRGGGQRLAQLDRVWGITQPTDDNAKAMRVSDLIGKDVQNREGNGIGEVEELVINMNQQKVHYAVLKVDRGWFGQEKRAMLPLRSFTLADGGDELRLNANKGQVQGMRDFERNDYGRLNNPVWLVNVDRYLVTLPSDWASNSGTQYSVAGSLSDAEYGKSVNKLMQAADSLRKSIQAMAQQPAGEARNEAIRQANQALLATNQAMIMAYDQQVSSSNNNSKSTMGASGRSSGHDKANKTHR